MEVMRAWQHAASLSVLLDLASRCLQGVQCCDLIWKGKHRLRRRLWSSNPR